MVDMLASSVGAVPLGPQTSPKVGFRPTLRTFDRAGAVGSPVRFPLMVRPRTQEDVIKLVALTCGQGASLRAGAWTLGKPVAADPAREAVLLDLGRLDRVARFCADSIWAEAGTVLAQVDRASRGHNKCLGGTLGESRETAGREAARAVNRAIEDETTESPEWLAQIKFVTVEATPRILRHDFIQTVAWLRRTGLRAITLEIQLTLHASSAGSSVLPAQLRDGAVAHGLLRKVAG